jgi:hypothetical protein
MRAVIEALQCLRGVAKVAAVTIVAELGELSRFERPRQLMGYGGIVPSEHSTGGKARRGAITKTGNAHLRRIVVEAAFPYRHRPAIGFALRKRQEGQSEDVKEIAWKAHGGESEPAMRQGFTARTRAASKRQLPTNHFHEGGLCPILEYQGDQPSRTHPRSLTGRLKKGTSKNPKNAAPP